MTKEEAKMIIEKHGIGYTANEFIEALNLLEPKTEREKDCSDCWHNYHCPMPQEGYDYNPDTCPYNPDNEK